MLPVQATALELHQLQYIVRAMYDLALTDGIHDTERVMLRGFYDQCQAEAGALSSFDDLVRTPIEPRQAKEVLGTPELAQVLIKSLLFLAYADGSYSAGERRRIREYAHALGIDDAGLLRIEDEIGDVLLQQISRIENTEALKQVVQELRPTD